MWGKGVFYISKINNEVWDKKKFGLNYNNWLFDWKIFFFFKFNLVELVWFWFFLVNRKWNIILICYGLFFEFVVIMFGDEFFSGVYIKVILEDG